MKAKVSKVGSLERHKKAGKGFGTLNANLPRNEPDQQSNQGLPVEGWLGPYGFNGDKVTFIICSGD